MCWRNSSSLNKSKSNFILQIPEMKEQLAEAERDEKENMILVFVIQNSGIIIGFLIILCIVQYGGEIQV